MLIVSINARAHPEEFSLSISWHGQWNKKAPSVSGKRFSHGILSKHQG
jgi:hypothetical protein